ncbi:MAG: ATP-binding cassette domain-containing protein [Planctomycetota bacterium]
MHAIDLRGVGFITEGQEILRDIHWAISRGESAAILGHNGSGKSTLLRLITGYHFPTVGTVEVLGSQLGEIDLHALRKEIGIVDPGSPFSPDHRLTVLEVVLTGVFGNLCLDFDHPTPADVALAKKLLADVGLLGHANQKYRTLSTGESRRTLLARALVHQPKLLILDEPTAGLDLLGRETMLATVDLLKKRQPWLTILTVTHHLEELSPNTDSILLLKNGNVLAKGPAEEVLQESLLTEGFGCPVRVCRTNGRWQWTVEPAIWKTLAADAKSGGER